MSYIVPYPDPIEQPVPQAPEPVVNVHKIWAKVTACSPQDPSDVEYYKHNGYKGATYNIAADYRQLPQGTQIYVSGYMESRNQYWTVDSPGGSVIRRSTREGVVQIDVKFRTYHSAKEWGTRWMFIDVVYPDNH